ncbi:XRE family transcriptional regulator [Brucellaceae bacterium VT-16-1752]|nr:XRE family transcriptional regulator [Brucellaceae bacterium VT-16-1752]
MLTGPLCRAGRALVEISRDNLAKLSKVDASVIEDFERKIDKPSAETINQLQSALEDLGAVFIPEDERGVGVRLKFTASEAKRIAILEGEGGILAQDDVT